MALKLRLLAALCAGSMISVPAWGREPGRVILVSLDALGYHIWTTDPAARELRTLAALARRGVSAEGVQPAFPSTTSNSHAAMWTGTWGDVSGITFNTNPLLPRNEHTFLERRSGFRADGLMAEPLWAAAARQGVRVVAHQAPQAFPFLPINTAPGSPTPPTVVNGYQTRTFAQHTAVRAADVEWEDASAWKPALPAGARCFRWQSGELTFHGALVGPDVFVAADPAGARVKAAAALLEAAAPQGREPARHFSAPLPLSAKDGTPCSAVFRLFEASGGDFLLFQSQVQELGLYQGGGDALPLVEQWARELGPFIPNGAEWLYEHGRFGKPLFEGGDGSAERRYMETVELVTRQYNRYSRALWQRYQPELMIDYFPYPDEIDHAWLGLVQSGAAPEPVWRRLQQMRVWAYRLVESRLVLLSGLLGRGDHLIVASDHGMAPVSRAVNVNLALEQAGLLARANDGSVDAVRSQAVGLRYCVLLNSAEYRNGTVPAAEREAVTARVEAALKAVTDNGAPVFTGFYRPGPPYGIGGPAGADLCYDVLPGIADAERGRSLLEKLPHPAGTHGLRPDRPDMLAILVGAGPRLPRGARWPRMKIIDVAPTVARVLGIEPPKQAIGQAPALRPAAKRSAAK